MVLSQRLSLVLRGGVSVLCGGQVVGTRLDGGRWEGLRTPENLISLRHGHCAAVAEPEKRPNPVVDYPLPGADASSRAGRSASRAGVLSRTAMFSMAGTSFTMFLAKEGTCLAAAILARLSALDVALAGKSLTSLQPVHSMLPSRLGVRAEVGRQEVHQSIWCKQASRTPPVSMWVRGA